MHETSYREKILSASDDRLEAYVGSNRPPRKNEMLRSMWLRLWRNKLAIAGLVVILLLLAMALLAPVLAPEGFDDQVLADKLLAPSWEHPFGTDNLGRDILARVIWGARNTLPLGLISTIASVAAGSLLGLAAGFYGGRTDNALMRILDVFMAIPPTLLAIIICAALGAGLINLMIAVAIGGIPLYARVARAAVLSVKGEEFVEAARCSAAGSARIIFRYVLPNCLSPIIVQFTLGVATSILIISGMSFIGLGLQPPTPEWGAMLSVGRPYIRKCWWACTFPGLMIMLSVMALNVFGDGLRDALDPKMKR